MQQSNISSMSLLPFQDKKIDSQLNMIQEQPDDQAEAKRMAFLQAQAAAQKEAEEAAAMEAAEAATLSAELHLHRATLQRHAAAIDAHEDVLKRHERAIAAEARGVTAASGDYGEVHKLLLARHEESRQQHERLRQDQALPPRRRTQIEHLHAGFHAQRSSDHDRCRVHGIRRLQPIGSRLQLGLI